jgi:hypothetical protein
MIQRVGYMNLIRKELLNEKKTKKMLLLEQNMMQVKA